MVVMMMILLKSHPISHGTFCQEKSAISPACHAHSLVVGV